MAKSLPLGLCLGLLAALSACSKGEEAPATAATPTTAAAPAPGAARITLPVEGMTCEGCESVIKDAVTALDGVTSCVASHTEKVATVEYDPAKVEPGKLAEVIAGLGYKVGPAKAPEAAR